MNEFVSEQERDGCFQRLLILPENKSCFDCGASNPKWVSVNNAIFLCYQCAGKHRTFGVQTSFVRSCTLDKWTRKQLKQMELGGNKPAKTYFDKHDLFAAGLHNYTLPLAVKYRAELLKKAEASLKEYELTASALAPLSTVDSGVREELKKANDDFFASKPVATIAPAPAPAQAQGSMRVAIVTKAVAEAPKTFSSSCAKRVDKADVNLKAKKLDLDFDALGASEPDVGYGTHTQEKDNDDERKGEEQPPSSKPTIASAAVESKANVSSKFKSKAKSKSKVPTASVSGADVEAEETASSDPTGQAARMKMRLKGISSTDYETHKDADAEVTQERQQRFAKAKAISSTDYYGSSTQGAEAEAEASDEAPSRLANAKEIGMALFGTAKDKAIGITNYAINWIQSFRKGSEEDS